MGFSEAEIAASIGLDKAGIHRHIDAMRSSNSWSSKTGKQRFNDLLDFVIPGTVLAIKESWRLAHSPANAENMMARAAFIGRVLAGMSLLKEFLPQAEMIKLQEDFVVQNAELDRLLEDDITWRDRIMQEARLSQRVISEPLNHPRQHMRQTGPNSWESKGGGP